LLTVTNQGSPLWNSIRDDWILSAHRWLCADATLTVLAYEWATSKVLAVAVLRQPECLIIQWVHDHTISIQTSSQLDLRLRTVQGIQVILCTTGGFSLQTFTVQNTGNGTTSTGTIQQRIFFKHEQLIQESVVNFSDNERQVFGHFIRNFDPTRDFLQRLSNLVIIRESNPRFLGILSHVIKVAVLVRVERFLHEILQRGLSDRPRAKPIRNRRTLNMLMNNVPVNFRFKQTITSGRYLVRITSSFHPGQREIQRRSSSARPLCLNPSQRIFQITRGMVAKGSPKSVFFHLLLLSRLRSTQRSKEVIGRFRSLDLFVQFLNFSALSVDLLSFLHRQLTVFGLGFLRKVAGSLQRGVALFHVCSHYKSPFIAIMLIVARARSGWPPDLA